MTNTKYVLSLFSAIVLIAVGYQFAHALPYAPGQTLDPACTPGSANCTVTQGLTVATSSLTSGLLLGAGTTTPTTSFQLQGSAGVDPFDISSSSGSSYLHVDNAGNVIVGASSINAPTDSAGFIMTGNVNQSDELTIHNPYAAGIELYTHATGNLTFRAPQIVFHKSRGTETSPTAVQSGDILGYLQYQGYGATQYIEGSVIESVAAENWTDTSAGTDINFYTNTNGSNSLHLGMKLRNDGKLGLGGINESTALANVLNVAGTTAIGLNYVTSAAPTNGLIVQGNSGFGTTTPAANFQVANGTNATTTVEFGSSGQNKGTCLKLYRTDGSAIYASVAGGATTFTLSTTACANVSGF